ncbi:MAG: DUF456 domain-containing protein [Gloeomargarita sp. DG02_5_bins_242]
MMFPQPSFPWLEQTLAGLDQLAGQMKSRLDEAVTTWQDTVTQVQEHIQAAVAKGLPPEVPAAVATHQVLVNQWLHQAQDRAELSMTEVQKWWLQWEQGRPAVTQQVTVRLQAVVPEPQQLQAIGGGMVGLMGGHVVGSTLGGAAGAVTLGPVGAVLGTQVGGFTGRVLGAHLGETLAGGQPLETIDARMQRLAADYMGSSWGATVGMVVGQVTFGPVGAWLGQLLGDAVGGQVGTNVYQMVKQGQAPADELWAIDHAGETASELLGTTLGRFIGGAQGQIYGARLGTYFGRKMTWQKVAHPSVNDLSPESELCYPKKETLETNP